MKKHRLFLIILSLMTINASIIFYSLSQENIRTVSAQNPNVVGCWNRVDALPRPCECSGSSLPGSVDSAENGEGVGTQGIRFANATCETSNENGPVTCSVGVGLPQYNSTCETPTPTPTPQPTPPPNCSFPANYTLYPTSGCPPGRANQSGCCICTATAAFIQQCERFGGFDPDTCGCTGDCGGDGSCSPIAVDISGNGFSLTNIQNGVLFDLEGKGSLRSCAWTAIDSDEAWLSLDRNRNGTIDNGRELFGNVTAQVPHDGKERNGFLALGEYDKAMNGGNQDGVISHQDYIFSRLRLWQDANHNGISESNELKTLFESGLEKIELDYRESRKVDQYGNLFKYRAKVRDAQNAQLNRWAWDVFLLTEEP